MVKYVDSFEFPESAGFSGSADVPCFKSGGYVKHGSKKKHDHPGPLPKNVKKGGGRVKKSDSLHDKMAKAGKEMGYAYGGKVKYSSMDDMDHANIQRRKATNQRDAESGGKTEVRPKFRGGGKAKKEMKMEEGGKKHWIKDAIKKPGALRKSLKVKAGQDIPEKKLEAAAKKPGKLGRRARLAETLRKMPRRA